MTNKPTIVKRIGGFSPMEISRRNYIFKTIEDAYSLYGYQQIETPAIETPQILMGKHGEEGDKLLFKVLNSGGFLCKADDKELVERNTLKLVS